ncbi:MAG: type IX secretion system protein PorQ [Bacteroidales bacterium]|nr:type IX secretion system protein PorQ [Bacteroidales bacterium]
MRKKLYILLVFLSLLSIGFAQQKDGTYNFLNMTSSSRVAALGGTILPIYNPDIQSVIYNPSLINSTMSNSLSLSYVDYYTDISIGSIQYGRTFNKIGSFVGTIQYNDYGDFFYADENGIIDEATFSASNYVINIGWGRQLNDKLSIGANLKFAGLQFENNSSFAIAVDVAGSYVSKSNWVFSLAALNIGSELHNNYQGFNSKLPFKMQAGLSKKLEHLPLTFIFVYDNIQKWDLGYDDPLDLENNYDPITGEMKKKSKLDAFADNLLSHVVVAGELNLGKNLTLRLGYNYGLRKNMISPTKKGAVGLSYGVAINVYKFNISYSRSEMHIHGSPNYITISTNLDSFKKH